MVWMLQYTFSFLVTVHVISSALVSVLLGYSIYFEHYCFCSQPFIKPELIIVVCIACLLRSLCTVQENKYSIQ